MGPAARRPFFFFCFYVFILYVICNVMLQLCPCVTSLIIYRPICNVMLFSASFISRPKCWKRFIYRVFCKFYLNVQPSKNKQQPYVIQYRARGVLGFTCESVGINGNSPVLRVLGVGSRAVPMHACIARRAALLRVDHACAPLRRTAVCKRSTQFCQ